MSVICLESLVHIYPNGTRALDGVNLTLDGTEPVAIVGQNGAGKSTLVKHFNGILRPTRGDVLINGHSVGERTTAQWSHEVGYVFQNPDDQLFLDSVRAELEFGPKRMGLNENEVRERVELAAEMVGLTGKLDVHPFDLNATDRKFCAVGTILAMNPGVIVFDEPTCGQDAVGNRRLADIIHALSSSGHLCVTISHDMKFVTANFKRVIVMNHGRVTLDGSVKEVFARTGILSESFVEAPPLARIGERAGLGPSLFTTQEVVNAIEQHNAVYRRERNTNG